jgi:S-adenosyl methyltransferase
MKPQPPPVDVREPDMMRPNAARMYDFYLGGAHNFEPDRVLAAQVEQVAPWVKHVARINRAWLHRAVGFMMERGVRQFLDLGSGIPTVGNVHEVAQRADPTARVVYVDHESVAVHHSYELLQDNENAAVVWADVREPGAVLEHPDVRGLIDFSQPVGLLIVGLLLFIADEHEPARLVRTYRAACPPGSYLAISTMSQDEADPETAEQLAGLLRLYESADEQVFPRDRATIESWFAGTTLVEPGLTLLDEWRPQVARSTSPARLLGYGAVGRVDG